MDKHTIISDLPSLADYTSKPHVERQTARRLVSLKPSDFTETYFKRSLTRTLAAVAGRFLDASVPRRADHAIALCDYSAAVMRCASWPTTTTNSPGWAARSCRAVCLTMGSPSTSSSSLLSAPIRLDSPAASSTAEIAGSICVWRRVMVCLRLVALGQNWALPVGRRPGPGDRTRSIVRRRRRPCARAWH